MGPDGKFEAAVLEARQLGARGHHATAAAVLERALQPYPTSASLRIALSHVRLADGSPPKVVEEALKAVLKVDPGNIQARHNLEVLYRNAGRCVEGVIDPIH